MIEIERYSNSLHVKDGIWCTSFEDEISYPSEANNNCFEIEDHSFWFKNRNAIILEVIKKYSIKGPMFDVGGGNGYVTDNLEKNGIDSILVEPGIEGCKNGKRRGLKYIINSFLDTENFLEGRIPNIGIFDVLEHIGDDKKFINTIKDLLVQDGRLFITVPSFNVLWSEEDNYAGHHRRYRKEDLEKLLMHNGFEIIYSTYFFPFLVFPIFIFRSIPSKLGIYKSENIKSKRQHSPNSFFAKILDLSMRFEIKRIKRSKSINIGSSLMVIAKKR